MSKSIKLKNNLYWDESSIKKNIIKVRQTVDQIASTNDLSILFQVFDLKIGTGLELQTNGKVKITNQNIHHVRIICELWVERDYNSYAWCHITKNGNMLNSYMLQRRHDEIWQSVSMEAITDVSLNDEIFPHIHFSGISSDNSVRGGTYYNSVVMYVESID